MDKLKAITYFLAVAEHGSFVAAARALGVPGSSISRRVNDLESVLGAELLIRTTRSVRLTQLGEVYRASTQPLVKAMTDADNYINEQSQQASGHLRITVIPGYSSQHFMPILNNFCVQYPKITVELEVTDRVLSLDTGEVDIAIRITANPPQNAVAKILSTNRSFLVASPVYLERHGSPSTLEEMQKHPTLKYKIESGILQWNYRAEATKWCICDTTTSFISNNGRAILDALYAHRGLALLPEWVVQDAIEQGHLHHIMLPDIELALQGSQDSAIYLLYHRPKYALKRLRLAIDYFREHLCISEKSEEVEA